ncbi:hypothetical protein ES703_19214 [subsurface metagenome]
MLAWFLVIHGVICVPGAFFPFYPPVFFFYWLFPGPFALKLIIMLVFGVAQVVFGVYLFLRRRGKQVRWYWLAIAIVVPVLALLVFPTLEGLFS